MNLPFVISYDQWVSKHRTGSVGWVLPNKWRLGPATTHLQPGELGRPVLSVACCCYATWGIRSSYVLSDTTDRDLDGCNEIGRVGYTQGNTETLARWFSSTFNEKRERYLFRKSPNIVRNQCHRNMLFKTYRIHRLSSMSAPLKKSRSLIYKQTS